MFDTKHDRPTRERLAAFMAFGAEAALEM